MLEKIFYKLDKNGKEKRMSDREIIIVFAAILLVCIIIIITAYKVSDSEKAKAKESKTTTLSEVLNILNDNYSMDVTKTLNGIETNVRIDCDSKVCLYSSDSLSDKEIIYYDEKWYKLSDRSDLENATVVETDDKELNSLINPRYYNYELIKSIIEVSEKESETAKKISVKTNLERFLKEYNYIFSETNKTEEDIEIPINLVISDTMVTNINIDYKEIDKYFTSETNDLFYNVYIRSINNTDLSTVSEYFEDKEE